MARNYCLRNYITGGTKFLEKPTDKSGIFIHNNDSRRPKRRRPIWDHLFLEPFQPFVLPSFLFPYNDGRETRGSVMNVQELGKLSIVRKIHFDQFVGSICDWDLRYHSKHSFLFGIVFLSFFSNIIGVLKKFLRNFRHKQVMFQSAP